MGSDRKEVPKDDGDKIDEKAATSSDPVASLIRATPRVRHDEWQYLDLISDILENGLEKGDRTGTGTYSVFGRQIRFSLRDGTLPLLTTKKMFYRGVAEELFWFIRGSTNAKELQEKGVRIWDGNSSKEFLKSVGLGHREEGDLGPVYGFQWRHFGAPYVDMHSDYSGQGVDQLAEVVRKIRETPNDRRIILCAWNPADLDKMALPPCHCLVQFYVAGSKYLSCQLYQRSADVGLGVPFNIASYAILTRMVAHVTGLEAAEFVHTFGDAHVYKDHVEPLKEQLKREPRPFPKLVIKRQVAELEDFTIEDLDVVGYDPHPRIPMEMSV